MRVGVLGPVRAERDGTPVRLGPRLVALLSVLVVEVGRPVPAARLMTLLWGDRSASAATLRSHVSHLRRALTPDPADARVLVTVGSAGSVGYQLDLPPERIDAWRFERAYDEGRRLLSDGATERAAAVFGEALALWRGPAYADVADQPFALREIARLDSMRRSVWRGHAEALCALGRYPEAVGQLVGAVADEPYDEALRRLLALALYAEQRVEEAAQVCREGLTLLRERGLDAPGLHEVQRAILRREAPPAAWPGPRAAPCLLPPEPVRFVGRTAEFERARRHLCDPMSAREALVVTGPAGVGKTTFAVRVAHTVADRFPDGQLYVNLRGFDPGGAATTPDEAVRGFLDALHVPAQRIPATLDARVGLYRSLLADRRILVVLDNARDAAQVRPLLPGAPGSAVLVTSRNQMTGLAAADGADPLVLDVLTAAEARLLLEWRLGVDRLVVEPLAVDEVVAACAGLPLALAVVAARACVHRKFPLGALAAELCTGRVGLDGFANGDAATDVRAVFSWSYRALAADAARMFRLLGLSPGPDVTVPVVASLAGLPVRRVRPLLTELCELHLVTEHAPGRYTFHDLLRAYATELAHTVDTPADRDAAQHRLVGHYLGTAHRAARLLAPHRDGIPAPAAAPAVAPEELADHAAALAWFTAERPALLGVVELAVRAGLDAYAWQLAWTLDTFFDYRGHWHDWAATQRTALAAARRLGDRSWEAAAHRSLGVVHTQLGRLDDGQLHFREALERYAELGDLVSRAHTHRGLGWVCDQRGHRRDALEHNERALALYRQAGHRAGQAMALNNAGWLHGMLGDHRRSLEYCAQAVLLDQEIGDRHAEAGAWDSLGHAHHQLGGYAYAVACYERALDLVRGFGDRYNEAGILDHLGDTYRAGGDPQAARATWRHALHIADELGHPAVPELQRKLTALDMVSLGPRP
ncbi:BTAD domain-containing putative transcriptional regulator [Micromonospora olivasterospora]